MKHLFAVLCLFAFWGTGSAARAEALTLAADEWCPYNCAVTDPLKGYVVDIVQEIFGKEGMVLRYVTTSWEDALEGTRSGMYDGAIGAAKDEAPDFVYPEQEIGRSGNDLFVPKDSTWTYQGTTSLKGKRLGVIRNYYYGEILSEYLENAVEGVDIIYALSAQPLRENLERLINGQIDVLVDDYNVAVYTARDMGLEKKIRQAGAVGDWDPVYIAFSPNNPRARVYARMLDEGVRKLRSSGRLKEIMQKYGLDDWRNAMVK